MCKLFGYAVVLKPNRVAVGDFRDGGLKSGSKGGYRKKNNSDNNCNNASKYGNILLFLLFASISHIFIQTIYMPTGFLCKECRDCVALQYFPALRPSSSIDKP